MLLEPVSISFAGTGYAEFDWTDFGVVALGGDVAQELRSIIIPITISQRDRCIAR